MEDLNKFGFFHLFGVVNCQLATNHCQYYLSTIPASCRPGLGAYEMTRGDQKDFTANGWKVGIAVLEVTDTEPVLKVADVSRPEFDLGDTWETGRC